MENKNIIGRNIILYQELVKVLQILDKKGIKVILLKGAGFLVTDKKYTNSRAMEDIDILIDKNNLSIAVDALNKKGYSLVTSGEWTFSCPECNLTTIDVHTSVMSLNLSDMRDIWKRSHSIIVDNIPVRVFAPEDNILYIGYHSVIHHACLKYTWMKDIVRIIQTEEINRIKLIHRIKQMGWKIPFYILFEKVAVSFKNTIPSKFIKCLAPSGLKEKILYRCQNGIIEKNKQPSEIGHFLKWLAIKGWLNKCLFLFDFFFPPVEFIKRRYSPRRIGSAYLFYIVRPVLLMSKAARELLPQRQ